MEVSMFYGIRISLGSEKNVPPFYIATYNDHEVRILIEDSIVWNGALPRRQLFMALAWGMIHHDELMEAWEILKDCGTPNSIAPLR